MPLLDHFHAPLTPARHWESFHVNWAGAITDLLNEHLLPEGYFAEEHTHSGARVEIDVATYEEPAASRVGTTAARQRSRRGRGLHPPRPWWCLPPFPIAFKY